MVETRFVGVVSQEVDMRNRLAALAAFVSWTATAYAAPEWMYTVNERHRLCGCILLGDERGTYWNGALPDGWKRLSLAQFEPFRKDARYVYFDQLFPKRTGDLIGFSVSKWNTVNLNLNRGFTEQAVEETLSRLAEIPEIRFHLAPGEQSVEDKLRSRNQTTPSVSDGSEPPWQDVARVLPRDAGLLEVSGTGGRSIAVAMEYLGGTVLFTLDSSAGDGRGRFQYRVKRLSESWRLDLDGDRKPDLRFQVQGSKVRPVPGCRWRPIKP
jgi:hypothetical protein